MRLRRIAHLVDHFHAGVERRVITDGVLAAGNIIINSAGDTDTRHTMARQILCTAERTVATDHDHTADAFIAAGFDRFLHTLFGLELFAAGRIQHGTAAMDDIRHTAQIHFLHIAVDQAVISTVHTVNVDSFAQRRAHDRTNGSIHTGCVAAACQNRQFLNSHSQISSSTQHACNH